MQSKTYLENRILKKYLKYLRYKTSEAYRKIRKTERIKEHEARHATLCM